MEHRATVVAARRADGITGVVGTVGAVARARAIGVRTISVALLGNLALSLCGCGSDGGGGVASTPAPPVATPTPTNTSISDLRASQSFTNDAARTTLAINLTSKTDVSAQAAAVPLSVRYDASTGSYAITSGSVTETFATADKQATSSAGETKYMHRSGSESSYLTLATTPYSSSTPNQYVGLGYYQHNTVNGDQQGTNFTTFTYGLDTPATGVPRSGTGTFNTDVFGLESVPGAEPEVFQGRGRFDVDFANSLFSTQTSVTRTGLITGSAVVGGGIDLSGGGRLAASDGTFSGSVVYSSGSTQIGGQITGRFYGPSAQEIGASFSGSASNGSAFNGSLTGQRDTSLTPVNISFATLVTPQLFYADSTTLTVRTPRNGGTPVVSDYPGALGNAVSRSQFTDKTSGNVSFGPPSSNLAGGDYTVTSIVPGDSNFTSYARTISGQPTRLELYKPGSGNKELALTYASFGRYSTSIDTDPLQSELDKVFFVYGFNTPSGLFANRTGTASYTGVAYGAGADQSGTIYDVTGTSSLAVNFSSQSLSGSLTLTGKSNAGTIDYGSFALAGNLYSYNSQSVASIARAGGSSAGAALINFYGPSAEEAGGIFRLRVPDGAGANTLINGAMVLKR